MEVLQLRAAANSGAVAATYDPSQDTTSLNTAVAAASLSNATPDGSVAAPAAVGPEPVLPPYVPSYKRREALEPLVESEDEGADILEHIGKPPSFSVSHVLFSNIISIIKETQLLNASV